MDYETNFITVKQENDLNYNQPVVEQNGSLDPEHAIKHLIKPEPQENNFLIFLNQSFSDCEGNQAQNKSGSASILKIAAVTQLYTENIIENNESNLIGNSDTPNEVSSKASNTKERVRSSTKRTKALKKPVQSQAIDKLVTKIPRMKNVSEVYIKTEKDPQKDLISLNNSSSSSQDVLDNSQIVEKTASIKRKTPKITPKTKKIWDEYFKYTKKSSEVNEISEETDENQEKRFKPDENLKKTVNPMKEPQRSGKFLEKNEKTDNNLKIKISRSANNKTSWMSSKILDSDISNSNNLKQETSNQQKIIAEPAIRLPFPGHMDINMINYEPKTQKKRKELRLECDNCDKVFKSKYSIIWHMKEHMLTMPYNCSYCGKGFSYERSFKQHELTHAAKVKCEICGKSLKPHAMYYHMKYRHTSEKTHQCPMCPKTFKTKDNISRHMMRHNMEFECNICGRMFPENSRLQMHLNMHENPEEFHCSICNKSFEHIARHMKRLHSKKRERNLKCQYCEYASDSKQTMRRHEEMHQKRNEIMQSKTRKRKVKQKIIKMKTFECKVCNVVLQTKSGYKSHLRHYHKGKEEVKAIVANETRDESSMESNEFVEIKIEKEEIRVIQ